MPVSIDFMNCFNPKKAWAYVSISQVGWDMGMDGGKGDLFNGVDMDKIYPQPELDEVFLLR